LQLGIKPLKRSPHLVVIQVLPSIINT
jgi:hypothetical protein